MDRDDVLARSASVNNPLQPRSSLLLFGSSSRRRRSHSGSATGDVDLGREANGTGLHQQLESVDIGMTVKAERRRRPKASGFPGTPDRGNGDLHRPASAASVASFVADDNGSEKSDDEDGGAHANDKSWCEWVVTAPKASPIAHPSLFHTSLHFLSPRSRFRIALYNLVTRSRAFEFVIVLLILANSLVLAFDGNLDSSDRPAYAQPLEIFFAVVFALEAALKMLALGLVAHRGSYLRSGWNVLDFLIVVLSLLVFIPGFANYTVFRTLRVIRPLRSVNAVKGLKVVVTAIVRSFAKLVHVAFLALLVFLIFGIVGVNLWGGAFRMRCVEYVAELNETTLLYQLRRVVYGNMYCRYSSPSVSGLSPEVDFAAAVSRNSTAVTLPNSTVVLASIATSRSFPDIASAVTTSAMGSTCPGLTFCEVHENPQFDRLSFDDLASAFLIFCEILTLEGWLEPWNISLHTLSTPIGFIYFFLLIAIAGFLIPNLCLAVITEALSHTHSAMAADLAGATTHGDNTSRQRRASSILQGFGFESADSVDPIAFQRSLRFRLLTLRNAVHCVLLNFPLQEFAAAAEHLRRLRADFRAMRSVLMAASQHSGGDNASRSHIALRLENSLSVRTATVNAAPDDDGDGGEVDGDDDDDDAENSFMPHSFLTKNDRELRREYRAALGGTPADFENFYVAHSELRPYRHRYVIVFIVLCIVLNTVTLAVRHYNEPQLVVDVTETANLVFVIIFSMEFLLTFFAVGPAAYVTDALLAMDGAIVVISVIEYAVIGSAILSVFRALRLLRILKLLRSIPSLRLVVAAIVGATSHTLYLALILVMLLFISALVGMQLFQGVRRIETPAFLVTTTNMTILVTSSAPTVARAHFDDFLNAFYTVFQIVARDNWMNICMQVMEASEAQPELVVIAAIFFVVVVLFGNLVILNMFLSILILSFNETDDEDPNAAGLEEAFLKDDRDLDAIAREAEAEAAAQLLVGSFYGELQLRRRVEDTSRIARIGTRGSLRSPCGASDVSGSILVTTTTTASTVAPSGIEPVSAAPAPRAIPVDAAPTPSTVTFSKNIPMLTVTDLSAVSGEHGHKADVSALQVESEGSDDDSGLDDPVADDEGRGGRGGKRSIASENDVKVFLAAPLDKRLRMVETGAFASHMRSSHGRVDLIQGLNADRSGGRSVLPNTVCQQCKGEIDETLPAPPLVVARRPIPFHYAAGRCQRCTVRRRRSQLLLELRDYCGVMAYLCALPVDTHRRRKNAERASMSIDHLTELGDMMSSPNVQLNLDFLFDFYEKVAAMHAAASPPAADRAGHLFVSDAGSATAEGARHRDLWLELQELLEIKRVVVVEGFRNGMEQIGGGANSAAISAFRPMHVTNGGTSLFLFGPENSFRVFLSRIVSHRAFDLSSAALIALSTVLLAFDNPRNVDPVLDSSLEIVNIVLTALFAIEIVMRAIAKGVYFNSRTALLRDPFGRLDAFVVVVSVAALIIVPPRIDFDTAATAADTSEIGALLRSMKALRALRPLRLIARNRGLRMIVATLMHSLRGIIDVAFICFLFFLVFAVLGVQLFSGRLYRCTDPTIDHKANCTGTALDDLGGLHERRWVNARAHFDNVPAALLTLFESAAGKWTHTLYGVIDAFDKDRAPVRDYNVAAGLFMVIVYMFGNFFLLRCFVAIVVHQFHRVKDRVDGISFLTDEQKLWLETQRLMLTFRPTVKLLPPSVVAATALRATADRDVGDDVVELTASALRAKHLGESWWAPFRNDPKLLAVAGGKRRLGCMSRAHALLLDARDAAFHLTTSGFFEVAIVLVILANICVLATVHYDQDATWDATMFVFNIIFVAAFALEAFLKLFALGFAQYFSVGWNRFDAFIVTLSVCDSVLDTSGAFNIPINFTVLRLVRIFRILRVLRLVKQAAHLRTLLETLFFALPALINVYLFMILVLIIYAAAGVQLFALVDEPVKYRQAAGKPGTFSGIDNAFQNFHNFGNAFMLLFSFTTGELWNSVMFDATVQYPECGFLESKKVTNITDGTFRVETHINDSNCGLSFAPAYFISFLLIAAYIVNNLIVEIVLDQFGTTLNLERHASQNLFKVRQFVDLWSELDPRATMSIPSRKFTTIVGHVNASSKSVAVFLKEKFGMQGPAFVSAKQRIASFAVPPPRPTVAQAALWSPLSPSLPAAAADEPANDSLWEPVGSDRGGNFDRDVAFDPALPTAHHTDHRAAFNEVPSRVRVLHLARAYKIVDHAARIHFVEVLLPLARLLMGLEPSESEVRTHQALWVRLFPDLSALPIVRVRGVPADLTMYFAATFIAAFVRGVWVRRARSSRRPALRKSGADAGDDLSPTDV